MSSKNIIHPKIIAIQKHIDLCNEFIRVKNWLKLNLEMILTIGELFPEDQPEELLTKLKNEGRTLAGFTYPSGVKNRVNKMDGAYLDQFFELQAHIAKMGYWTAKKYEGMRYPNE